ncbi:GNAT family N-acetyltransferase [Candidatus Woesearchaeota archaeon]|nr:GNAT family N-acetyltransferase [Candidatus Woesearchaeota archaeon]
MAGEAVLESRSLRFLEPAQADEATGKGLEGIVRDSFGVAVSDDYFPYLIQNNAQVYFVHEPGNGMVGAAVVIENPAEGMPPHLVTLAVASAYKSQGIGKDIMAELLKYYPKLNWRSKPDRMPARNLYRGITDDTAPFTAVDGINYNGYFVNHTPEEKQKATSYMAAQPSHFKK